MNDRRSFLLNALLTFTATELGTVSVARAASLATRTTKLSADRSNGTVVYDKLKQIDAGVLSISYAEHGPASGPPVILLHGWPYDIYSFAEATPLLASKGYHVIVPYLRGYGPTRFLSDQTCRNGQPSALAVDIIALMDALKMQKAVIGGFDWGARTANIVAALWPERVKAMVSVSGYLIGNQAAGKFAATAIC
jgi:pimeloyl-ACP methyl ester carboxylesterase